VLPAKAGDVAVRALRGVLDTMGVDQRRQIAELQQQVNEVLQQLQEARKR
jgi:hypothetical protein